MEDRDVSDYEDHSTQLGMLPQFGQCDRVMLSAIPTSAMPGGDHPAIDLCKVLNCNFRTPLLRNSKARQSWYNHQYSHNDDRFRDSMRDYMEEDTGKTPLRTSMNRLMMNQIVSLSPERSRGCGITA